MNKPLATYLSEIPEFRRQNKNFAHPLLDILLLSISAVFCGAEDFEEIALFGKEKESFLKKLIPFANGIPSHDTLRRVFMLLDSAIFNEKFMSWVSDLLSAQELSFKQISIDGKALRGTKTGIYLVSAVASELGISLGQVATEEKSNEIKAVPELLDLLYLKGCIVSLDAMGTQKEIAKKIIEKEGDYFLALKGNQKNLLEQVQKQFELEKVAQNYQFSDWTGSHNEVVDYEVSVCHDLKWVENAQEWTKLNSLARIKSTSPQRGEYVRYYISSVKELKAEEAMQYARNHWAVENKLHWQLDVTLREDQKRNRMGFSAQNLSLLRKILLNTAAKQNTKLSKKKMIKKMMWNEDYFLEIIAQIIKI